MRFSQLSNKKKGDVYRANYQDWKKMKLNKREGYCIIFKTFEEKNILKSINGGALKLYVFLNLHSKPFDGHSFYSVEEISKYFEVSTRTISNWIKELEDLNLIARHQEEYNSVSHNFLQTY